VVAGADPHGLTCQVWNVKTLKYFKQKKLPNSLETYKKKITLAVTVPELVARAVSRQEMKEGVAMEGLEGSVCGEIVELPGGPFPTSLHLLLSSPARGFLT